MIRTYTKILILAAILVFAIPGEGTARDRSVGSKSGSGEAGLRQGTGTGTAKWFVEINSDTDLDASRIIFGVDDNATTDYDSGYDAVHSNDHASRISTLPISLYFDRSGWGQSNPFAWVDVTGPEMPHDWLFTSFTKNTGKFVRLTWDSAKVASLPVTLILVDNYSGVVIDMASAGSYSYTSLSQRRSFTVTGESADSGSGVPGLRTR